MHAAAISELSEARLIGRVLAVFVLLFALAGCATQNVDVKEPKRVLGTEEDVRVDAQIFADNVSPGAAVRVAYDITNQRSEPIAIADIVPDASFDEQSRTVTINIGSEVPGNELLPRLVAIASGDKKSFAVTARMPMIPPSSAGVPTPRYLRIAVHFLGEVKPFEALVDIPEKSIHDPERASTLFTKWVESTESVHTNAIPITWSAGVSDDVTAPARRRG